MIGRATSDALNRIAQLQDDLRGTFAPGFLPKGNDINASQAPLPAADPLSVAAPAGAYFVTKGSGDSPQFTRDGGFTLVDGSLRSRSGAAVLGVAKGGGALVPLRVDPVDSALGRARDVSIEADGALCYTRSAIDPRTGERLTERVTAGKLALARFPAGTLPVRLDGTTVAAPRGVSAHIGTPGDGNFAGIATYSRDAGGVDFDWGLERLQEAYQLLDAIRASGRAHGSVEKTTMDLLK